MVKITKFFTETDEGEAYLDAVAKETVEKRAARPRKRRSDTHRPTPKQRAQVEALSGFGVRQVDIASYIGVSLAVLVKHYRKNLDAGMIYAEAEITKTLYNMAKSGKDFQATKFWLIQRAKHSWVDVQKHEIDITGLREHARRRAQELGISEDEAAEIVAEVERKAKAGTL